MKRIENDYIAAGEKPDFYYILRNACYAMVGSDFAFTVILCLASEILSIFYTYFIS
jgi:hypothetical protein